MGSIITFPRHKLEKFLTADGEDTGLVYCPTCGGAEGSLPENCPQRRMTNEEETLVLNGLLDYRIKQGGWTKWTRSMEMAVRGMLT